MAQISRNEPCPCGSGQKYKKCCELTGGPKSKRRALVPMVVLGIAVLAGIAAWFWTKEWETSLAIGGAGLVAAGGLAIFMDPPPPRGGGSSSDSINFGR